MDANNTQWLVKPNNVEIRAFRWSGNRVDFIHSPEWLRSMVYDWEFERYLNATNSIELFYTNPVARKVVVAPGEYILRIGDSLFTLSDDGFRAMFMGDHLIKADENQT